MHLRRNCVEQERKHGGAVGGNAGHLRLDGLAERPPLHLGLEPHVGDLQAEAVPVHAAVGVVGVGVEVVGGGKWAGIIDWEAAGGCGTHLPGAARPPTGFPSTFLKLSGGGGLVAEPLSRTILELLEDNCKTHHLRTQTGDIRDDKSPTGFLLPFLKLSDGGGLVAGPYLSGLPYLTLSKTLIVLIPIINI